MTVFSLESSTLFQNTGMKGKENCVRQVKHSSHLTSVTTRGVSEAIALMG